MIAAESFDKTDSSKAGSDTEMAPINTKGKPKATRATKGADGKKRTASEKSGDTENGDGEAPAKKVKLEKKGTAKVVKKSNVEIPSASEGENGENGEGKKKVAAKAKAKPKAKPATKGKGKLQHATKLRIPYLDDVQG